MKPSLIEISVPDTRAIYVTIDSKKYGPYTKSELRKYIQEDRVTNKSQIWFEGLAGWTPISQVSEFASYLLPGWTGPAFDGKYPEAKAGAALGLLAPIGRSGYAVAAGYFGLFSVVPFCGVAAIICSLLGFRDLKRHPTKRGMGRLIFGLVTGLAGTAFYGYALYVGFARSLGWHS